LRCCRPDIAEEQCKEQQEELCADCQREGMAMRAGPLKPRRPLVQLAETGHYSALLIIHFVLLLNNPRSDPDHVISTH
jgi:hypothetical protein